MPLPLIFKATVVPGRGVGTKLGFPTLNFLPPDNGELQPAVYAGYVNEHPAVFNYGPRPTFNLKNPVLEAHLLNFSGKWEEHEVQVTITDFLRKIRKFDSVEELKKQIKKDVEEASSMLNGAHDRT